MSAIIKNKNIIEFQLSETKTYRYDVNSGILYGLRQKPLKNIPADIVDMVNDQSRTSNLIYYLACGFGQNEKERFANAKTASFFDRLDTAGFPMLSDYFSTYYIPTFEKHFKEIRKEFIEEEKPIRLLHNRLRDYDFSDWLEENGLKIDDHFTQDMASFLKSCNYPKKWIPRLAYYLCKDGLWNFFSDTSPYTLQTKFHSFIQMMEAMGRTPEKGSFIRQYSEIKTEYDLKKEEFDNILLNKNQSAHANALNFSYDDFEVVIPLTSTEFINEGENQSNCVARVYLPKVLRGETNVVFVRKKGALDTSYITCEVCEGKIKQFLLRYNESVATGSPEAKFYKAYAEHLSKNWGE